MDLKIRFTNGAYDISRHGAWIDLRAKETYTYKAGEHVMIGLGINIAVPVGYEGMLAARSSTFKKYGLIQTNAVGIIESDYCGNDDEWIFSAVAMRDGIVEAGDRVCQFRVQEIMDDVDFIVVEDMGSSNRGGFGSTGSR